jgi:hypothetical protein
VDIDTRVGGGGDRAGERESERESKWAMGVTVRRMSCMGGLSGWLAQRAGRFNGSVSAIARARGVHACVGRERAHKQAGICSDSFFWTCSSLLLVARPTLSAARRSRPRHPRCCRHGLGRGAGACGRAGP